MTGHIILPYKTQGIKKKKKYGIAKVHAQAST